MAEQHEALDDLAAKAIRVLSEFLDTDEPTKADFNKARIASSALSTQARVLQTVGARETMQMAMARELAHNKDELRKYISLTQPSTPLAKVFPAPTNLPPAIKSRLDNAKNSVKPSTN